jgi:hypothetical protein
MAAILSIIVGIVQFLVGFRFVFLLLGANPNNAFVSWVYDMSSPLVAPFSGIFGQATTEFAQGAVVSSVFDWTSLIALVIYGILGAILVRAANGLIHHRPHYYN